MKKWILLALGCLLLLPETWYLISDPIRPDDGRVAFENLVEVPDFQLREHHSVNITVTAPNDAAWKRIRRSWGDPKYAILLLTDRVAGADLYCFDAVSVNVTQEGRQLSLERAAEIYGFSTHDSDGFSPPCKVFGPAFGMPPGSSVQIHITAQENELAHGTKIAVRPVWTYTKDKLVGLDIDKDLRPIVKGLAALGLGMTLVAALFLVRGKRMPKEVIPQKNVPA